MNKEAEKRLVASLDPNERTFFIERTGVVMRWILIFTCSVIQIVKPVIPSMSFYLILPVCILYNFLINVFIYRKRQYIILISQVTATLDILVSAILIYLSISQKNDIYLWYFVLLVSHAARFGFLGAIISPVIFSIFYFISLKVSGVEMSAHAMFIRLTFFIITGIVSGYLAREEHKRFNNILKQQREIFESQQKRKEMRDVLQRYVSYNVVEELLSAPESLGLGGTKRKVSILFSDIEGFTSLLSRMEAENVIMLLNEYFTEMTNIIFQFGGMVDKFVGDAIIGIFGAIKPEQDDSLRAVRCAMAMQKRLRELQEQWKTSGEISINSRIAVNTGEVIMGNIGSPKRMDYTAIGDPVNITSRMQAIAESGGVVISGNTYEEIKEMADADFMGNIQLRGRVKPIAVYVLKKLREAAK